MLEDNILAFTCQHHQLEIGADWDSDICVHGAAGLFARACKALGQPAVCASIADDAANLRGVLIERLAEMSVRRGRRPSLSWGVCCRPDEAGLTESLCQRHSSTSNCRSKVPHLFWSPMHTNVAACVAGKFDV